MLLLVYAQKENIIFEPTHVVDLLLAFFFVLILTELHSAIQPSSLLQSIYY